MWLSAATSENRFQYRVSRMLVEAHVINVENMADGPSEIAVAWSATMKDNKLCVSGFPEPDFREPDFRFDQKGR
jgi:hypothetical protein